jgi:DNA-binding PadR family transcriptional regulator
MNGEMSGYDLKRWMSYCTSNFFDASFGSIYPALKRLEEKGFINSRETVEGNKLKKLYSINNSGKTYFYNWLDTPIAFAKTKQDHLIKIFFYDRLPKRKAVANLQNLAKQVEPILNYLENHKCSVEAKYDTNLYYFQFSTIDYGIGYYQFVIDWCNDLIKKLEEQV